MRVAPASRDSRHPGLGDSFAMTTVAGGLLGVDWGHDNGTMGQGAPRCRSATRAIAGSLPRTTPISTPAVAAVWDFTSPTNTNSHIGMAVATSWGFAPQCNGARMAMGGLGSGTTRLRQKQWIGAARARACIAQRSHAGPAPIGGAPTVDVISPLPGVGITNRHYSPSPTAASRPDPTSQLRGPSIRALLYTLPSRCTVALPCFTLRRRCDTV